MPLDLLIVSPSSKGVYHKKQEASSYAAVEPPYQAALTAEFVRRNGYDVRILDANAENLTTTETAEQIKEANPRLVHVVVHGNQPSASSQLMTWTNTMMGEVKARANTPIMLSGTHPAALPERTLREGADFVARGDGFYTPLSLLKGNKLDQVPGLWFIDNGALKSGPPEKLMNTREMSEGIPRAAWDLLPMEKYRAHDWHCLDNLDARQPYAAIYTSFGCPFSCTFCCINAPFNEGGTTKNQLRTRDPKLIVDELESLVTEHGVRNVKFIDEMYVFDRKHYLSIADEIIHRGLGDKLNIWAYARVDTIKEGLLDKLKQAGINWLVLGIESGSAHVRADVAKGKFGESDIVRNVRAVQQAGINVLGNYIFGLPDENISSMQATLDLAAELACERPNFYSAMAYPGSELHRMAQQGRLPLPPQWPKGRALLPEDAGGPGWIGYSQHAYECWPLPTAHLIPEEVLAFRDKALSYYTSPSYVEVVRKRFGQKAVDLFCPNNAAEPKRMILGK